MNRKLHKKMPEERSDDCENVQEEMKGAHTHITKALKCHLSEKGLRVSTIGLEGENTEERTCRYN